MRKLGLIGGMSWASTRDYYETINRAVQRRVSPLSSAPLLIESLDFAALRGIEDDALDRTHLDTLRRFVVADAFGAERGRDLVDLPAFRDRPVRTDGLADVAVDAEIGDLEGHGRCLT